MEDDLVNKVDKLTNQIEELKTKGKDSCDKFQIVAALHIPASITLVGLLVSTSLKEAESLSQMLPVNF